MKTLIPHEEEMSFPTINLGGERYAKLDEYRLDGPDDLYWALVLEDAMDAFLENIRAGVALKGFTILWVKPEGEMLMPVPPGVTDRLYGLVVQQGLDALDRLVTEG